MTYLQFHLAFTLPALAAVVFVQGRPLAGVGARTAWTWLGAVVLLAVVYTTPWDNYLVYRGVWGYPDGAVLGTIGYVPLEEYAFFVIQTLVVGLFYFALRGYRLLRAERSPVPHAFRRAGVATWGILSLIGYSLLLHPSDQALYMGLILGWAPPVLAGMWWIGSDKIWHERRRIVVATTVPTLYLWAIDRIAIQRGIWDIRDAYSLGFDPLGLPIEEAAFFLVTTALCVVGLVLFLPSSHD